MNKYNSPLNIIIQKNKHKVLKLINKYFNSNEDE